MKKVILSVAIIIATVSVNAQNKFGLQGGASFASAKSTFTGVTPSEEQKFKTKVGFTIGAVADIDFGNSVSFRPELNFIQKGGKLSNTETRTIPTVGTITTASTGKTTFNYIELAPNFVYNFEAGDGKFFVGVGPNVAFGLGGKNKYTSTTTSTIPGSTPTNASGENKVKFDGKKYADVAATDNDDHLKALDFGANAIAGYKMSNGAFVSAGYTVGLSNIDPNDKQTFKNNGFNVKVGFLFGGSKK